MKAIKKKKKKKGLPIGERNNSVDFSAEGITEYGVNQRNVMDNDLRKMGLPKYEKDGTPNFVASYNKAGRKVYNIASPASYKRGGLLKKYQK